MRGKSARAVMAASVAACGRQAATKRAQTQQRQELRGSGAGAHSDVYAAMPLAMLLMPFATPEKPAASARALRPETADVTRGPPPGSSGCASACGSALVASLSLRRFSNQTSGRSSCSSSHRPRESSSPEVVTAGVTPGVSSISTMRSFPVATSVCRQKSCAGWRVARYVGSKVCATSRCAREDFPAPLAPSSVTL